MKLKRHKHVRRVLGFYKSNYGFKEPYQILLDGTFCMAALRGKVNIAEQLPKYLSSEVKLFTTPCVLHEVEGLGSVVYGALVILKQFIPHRCKHVSAPVSGSDCLKSLIHKGNPHKFCVATQDKLLTERIHREPGIPILFLYMNTICLEKPSAITAKHANKAAMKTVAPSSGQKLVIQSLKKSSGLSGDSLAERRKRKGPKGPNPMSCKKPKKKPVATDRTAKKKKRNRKHKLRKIVCDSENTEAVS